MSFLGVKVILFLVIPLIIKEKSNASALKPMRKLSRIDRYEHVERSIRVFISTVMNMWNGRYETNFQGFRPIFSRLSPDFQVGFRQQLP